MASGKSSTAIELQKFLINKGLKVNLWDIDTLIEKQENITIKDIFKEKGEAYFRKLEAEYITNLFEKIDKNTINLISLGGGCFSNTDLAKFIQNNSDVIIYLETSLEEIKRRLSTDNQIDKRPLLQSNDIDTLYHKRLANYKLYSDITISTNNQSSSSLAYSLSLTMIE